MSTTPISLTGIPPKIDPTQIDNILHGPDQAVWCLNRLTDTKGNRMKIMIPIEYGNNTQVIIVPNTFAPIPMHQYALKPMLLSSKGFMDRVREQHLMPITKEEAEQRLKSKITSAEYDKMMSSKHVFEASEELEVKQEPQKVEVAETTDEVRPAVMDIAERDNMDPLEQELALMNFDYASLSDKEKAVLLNSGKLTKRSEHYLKTGEEMPD